MLFDVLGELGELFFYFLVCLFLFLGDLWVLLYLFDGLDDFFVLCFDFWCLCACGVDVFDGFFEGFYSGCWVGGVFWGSLDEFFEGVEFFLYVV